MNSSNVNNETSTSTSTIKALLNKDKVWNKIKNYIFIILTIFVIILLLNIFCFILSIKNYLLINSFLVKQMAI